MRRLYPIFLILIIALALLAVTQMAPTAEVDAAATAETEPEPCTLFLPLVSGCDGFWFSCPRETWTDCECPWCLPGEMYCVKWDPSEMTAEWLASNPDEYQSRIDDIPATQP
jgi:hypothetical protein